MMQTTAVPEADRWLLYNPSFLSVDGPEGLWLCTAPEDAAAISINAAALPAGAGADHLRNAKAFLEAFSEVLIVGADPERRQELARLVQGTLPGLTVSETAQEVYRGCGSVVELKEKYGLGALDKLGQGKRRLPPWGLLEASQVEAVDLFDLPRNSSGLPELDRLIGGFFAGEVSVWTGKRKEGKSTLLGLPILAALRAGAKVCVYSGELPAWRYKSWLLNMAAGPDSLWARKLDTGRLLWFPPPEVRAQIDLWWAGRLFIVDNQAENIHQGEKILGVLRTAAERYGCTVFVVDNLMTVELSTDEYYRAQGRFVGQLSTFARETGSHVHLVAHRRKNSTGKGDADDVSGSAEITNRADNTFSVCRESELDGTRDATLSILNNRDFGESGEIALHFDQASRRFYTKSAHWCAGWEEGAEWVGGGMPWAREPEKEPIQPG